MVRLPLFYIFMWTKGRKTFFIMKLQDRRKFLERALKGGAGMVSLGYLPFMNESSLQTGKSRYFPDKSDHAGLYPFTPLDKETRAGKEAMFYQKLGNSSVQCQLCPRECIIDNGKSGFCRVRRNTRGTLYSMVYGRPCSVDVGPIEKAPLYHFIPGHQRLCLATVGCNLRCTYCQNWHISQRGPGEVREFDLTPRQIVEEAKRQGVSSISFTYSEPTIFYEYMHDISILARQSGLKVSIVSNGYMNPRPLRTLLACLDGVKIDLKAFSEDFYREVSSARLQPVMQTLKVLKEERAFFEIVNLVIPTLNDNPDEIRKMCVWIRENLGEEVPLHFSRFYPTYKLTNLPSTPVRTLEAAVGIACGAGLKYVYIGNVPGHKHNSTFCPHCGERLIHRTHFSVLGNNVENGKCKFCGYGIDGIWD